TLSLLLVIAVAGCGGYKSSNTPVSPGIAFLYMVGQGSNTVNGFAERNDGQLASLAIATVPTVPIPVAMALTPSKNFFYVANSASNAVSGFTVDHISGVLAPIGTAVLPTPVGTNPMSLGVNSGGQFLFVLNQGSTNISVLSIDSTRGLLTQIGGSPFTVAANPQSLSLKGVRALGPPCMSPPQRQPPARRDPVRPKPLPRRYEDRHLFQAVAFLELPSIPRASSYTLRIPPATRFLPLVFRAPEP